MKHQQVRTREITKARQPLLRSIEEMVVNAGLQPAPFFKELHRELRWKADPQRALNNLHRFLTEGFTSTLLRDFVEHPVLLETALEIFSQSQYLADILVRDPELFQWLTSSRALTTTKNKEDFVHEAVLAVKPFQRLEKKLDALKRFHRRELLRIGARDILREADVVTITAELSALADAIVDAVLGLGFEHLTGNSGSQLENTLAVIGLGKLGGEELNFSSDIDLLFVYDRDGEIDLPEQRIHSLHEFYVRLSEFIVRKLTEHTDEGHLFRVDMRLRPDGGSGPLAMSRESYISYYETRGELWERQMLVKARVVAGIESVGEQWLKNIRPFVYPRTQLGSPLQEIREMKRHIEAKLQGETNIKLGSGGIRDIEFIVQALQLINAGTVEHLRDTNTLRSVDLLAKTSRITLKEARSLRRAYEFFRTVEHRLQLIHGLQIHSLPSSSEEIRMLAKRLRFRTDASFQKQLAGFRGKVRRIFDSVFQARVGPRAAGMREPGVTLEKLGVLDLRQAQKHLSELERLLPALQDPLNQSILLARFKAHAAPDWGLRNLVVLASSPAIRQAVEMALHKKETIDLLTLIASRSSRMSELLAREPLLFETLVGRPEEMLREAFGWSFHLEHDRLRYRAYNEFKILLGFLLNQISIEEATCRMSNLADQIIRAAFSEIEEDLWSQGIEVSLLALGKLGGRELTVDSDLDLFFVFRGMNSNESRLRANTAVQKFLENFSATPAPVYEVDLQMRPEGRSAPLATDMKYYLEYLQGRASLWERQSLLKSRVICGSDTLNREVERIISDALYGSLLPKNWPSEVRQMKTRIERERGRSTRSRIDLKVCSGGLMDLEFLLQALQLKFGREKVGLRDGSSFQIAAQLLHIPNMKKRDAKSISENLLYLRRLETYVRLNSESSAFVLPDDQIHAKAIAAAMGERNGKSLLKRIAGIRNENRLLFKAAMKISKELR